MAAPENLPPIPQLDSTGLFPYGFTEPPPRPAFIPNTMPNEGQNHSRDNHGVLSQPPPPPSAPAPPPDNAIPVIPQTQHQPGDPPGGEDPQNSSDHERRSQSGDGSSSDREDSEEEEEPHIRWRPMEEDTTAPCEDELKFIEAKGEHSALDHTHWEKETFFDLDDPEVRPGESGRIAWLVEHFNGTQENPNKEYIMRSPTVSIGGYDWRIKFYPKGNDTEHLSAYVENVSMQSPEFEESEDFVQPPLPFLNSDKLKKRRSVAVQLSIIIYNPAEPRVHEHHSDAHQFTKSDSDYGWTHFSRHPRSHFPYRMHGQRQAILRNDKLAFSAYIRVVNDPTGCLWEHGTQPYEDSSAVTGLRPFTSQLPMFAAEIPLLHFAPFRDFVYRCKDATRIVHWYQVMLWKMLSRTRSKHYGEPVSDCVQSDTIAWLAHSARHLRKETDPGIVEDLIGPFDAASGSAIGGNRLRTKTIGSVQAALDAHLTYIATPALLSLELERHEFEKEQRKWVKLTNKVEMQNKIEVGGKCYTLFAFATHCGDLESNRYNVYVRPNGLGSMWYGYLSGSVTCLTHKQAVDKHSGCDDPTEAYRQMQYPGSRGFRRFGDEQEVAHVVMYVRDDCAFSAFAMPVEEAWDVPDSVRKDKSPPKEEESRPPAASNPEQVADPEQGPPQQPENERKNSFDEGFATPNGWLMDGEDVIMSDADDDSIYTNEGLADSKASPDEPTSYATLDFLGREYYKGGMLNHEYQGEGHLISMNGNQYTGKFRAGTFNGHGKMVYASNGNIYEGEWLDGQQHGSGKLTEASTGNVFEGSWKNGKKTGKFVLQGTVTDEDKGCCSICYDKEISTAFYDCGHVVACKECAHSVENCPVCRKRVLARLELFGVKMSFE